VDKKIPIDLAALVPLQVETILNSSCRAQFDNIQSVLIGGAALNPLTMHELKSLACTCYATYGMTETLSHIALQQLNGRSAQDYFEALPGIKLDIDERGCLVIHAPHLSNKPFVTNDLVALVTPSRFRWLGRADNIINTGGIKVIPEKVEAAIELIFDHLKIARRFFVTGLPDPTLGQSVTLIIEGDALSPDQERQLHEKMMDLIDRYELPKTIHYVSEFATTDTGKTNKLKTIALLQS
jgi:O-succinylbenzoic acid--CoA ligase